MKRLKFTWRNLLLTTLFLVGLGIFSYPLYRDAISKTYDQMLIRSYQRKSAREDREAMAKLRAAMEKKNEEAKKENQVPGDTQLLAEENKVSTKDKKKDFWEEHTLGILTIPKLKTTMPVFDTGSDAFLNKGAAHLKGTSLPVGGVGTHSVIMAHRGLPEAELFSRLPSLEKGDLFIMEILGEKLAYEVDQIKTIEPTNIEDLKIVEDKDYMTLLTCTPYMVNSHRYIVRGFRVPYEEKLEKEEKKVKRYVWLKVIGVFAGLIAAVIFIIWFVNRKKSK